MEEEIWKDISEYVGIYQISNFGNVKSLSRDVFRGGKYFFTTKEKYLSQSLGTNGYLKVGLFKETKTKTKFIHQLVAIAFLNHIPCGMDLVVNHINFIKTDNRLSNLEVITFRENTNQKHKESSSKFTGVSWNKKSKKWVAAIVFNNKTIHLGSFNNEVEASIYYENALLAIENGEDIQVTFKTTSQYKGVHWSNWAKKWKAVITSNGITKHIGYFKIELEASEAYKNYKW